MKPARLPLLLQGMRHSWYRLLWGLAALLFLFPVRFTSLRALLLLTLLGLWVGTLVRYRKRRFVPTILLTATAIAVLTLLLPGRPAEPDRLREEYLHALLRYQGTPYIWGGETHTGIDCSGLIRAGMTDARIASGLRTANPALLRDAVSLWWYDCSARALGEEYQGNTVRFAKVRSLNTADYSQLQPGDIAVTATGLHTLAYLGDRTWIEADPNVGRVITVRAPSASGWFDQGMTLLRWRNLCAAPPARPR